LQLCQEREKQRLNKLAFLLSLALWLFPATGLAGSLPSPASPTAFRIIYSPRLHTFFTISPSAPQTLTPHDMTQALLSVFDATNNALRLNGNPAAPAQTPTPHNADQVFLSIFDATNNALQVNCVNGCGSNPGLNQITNPTADWSPNLGSHNVTLTGTGTWNFGSMTVVGGKPRLDQILNPTADKTFLGGTHTIGFDFTTGVMNIGATHTLGNVILNVGDSATLLDGPSVVNIGSVNDMQARTAGLQVSVQDNGGAASSSITGLSLRAQSTHLLAGGLLDSLYGLDVNVGNLHGALGGGNVTDMAAIYIGPPSGGTSATVTNNYGLLVDNQSSVSVNAYAMKTGLGKNSLGDRLTVKSNAAAVQPITFTGSGLNDATSGGTYTGISDFTYCVKIDATGTPDTFSWGTAGSCTSGATGVSITGSAQTLSLGVTITFAATTGHTNTDHWDFTAYAPIPLTLQNHSGSTTMKIDENGFIRPTAIAVGSLPTAAAANAGWQIVVNDSTAITTEGQTCVGTSNHTALAFSDGSVWKCF
jgi:hypothetical protein